MNKVIAKAKEKYFQHSQTFALCHYVIKNNKVRKNNKEIKYFVYNE
jgi:hypothetical protein